MQTNVAAVNIIDKLQFFTFGVSLIIAVHFYSTFLGKLEG